MSYEDSPATEMLSTHCAVCGRPLLDAISVETGIGPDCRRRTRYMDAVVDEAVRAEANTLVHLVAKDRKGPKTPSAIERLRELGFVVLASKLAAALTPTIDILEIGNALHVSTPYAILFVEDVRKIPGRRWDPESKRTIVPLRAARLLYEALVRHFPGALGRGKKGLFVLPGEADQNAS